MISDNQLSMILMSVIVLVTLVLVYLYFKMKMNPAHKCNHHFEILEKIESSTKDVESNHVSPIIIYTVVCKNCGWLKKI